NVTLFGETLFAGLFTPLRSLKLRTLHDVLNVLAGRYHSIPPLLLWPLLLGWLGALLRGRQLLTDPLLRTCVLGPVVGIAIFIAKSPYAEVRFLFPSMVLLFAAAGAGANRWLPR